MVDDVLCIGRKLDAIIKGNSFDEDSVLDMLKVLQKMPISLETLRQSRLGLSVKSIKNKTNNTELLTLTRSLIKDWKKLIPDGKQDSYKTQKTFPDRGETLDNNEKPTASNDTSRQDIELKMGTYTGKDGVYVYDGSIVNEDEHARQRDGYTMPIPQKNSQGVLVFPDTKEFCPNMTPKEVLQAGSFGGTYFRPIKSSVTGLQYSKLWNELPQNWLEGLKISKMISSNNYDVNMNTYKVKSGGDLNMWESSGWITKYDPYGWFMWYCRFYLGRRCADDVRQIKRWKNCAGAKGRWKGNLIGKVARAGSDYNNHAISPVVRQTLQHWGYKLTEKDYKDGKKRMKL